MSQRVLASGLGYNVAREVVREYFAQFGALAEFKLQVDCEGYSRGFAFLRYSYDSSLDALFSESVHRIAGKVISVAKVDEEPTVSSSLPSRKLLISFLGLRNVTETVIRNAFQEYGAITDVYFPEVDSRAALSYCVVTFCEERSVDECLKKQHCLNGRSVFIRKAVRKEDVKKAEQIARERADRAERSKHGYAGYGAVPCSQPTNYFPHAPSLLGNNSSGTSKNENPYAHLGGYSTDFPTAKPSTNYEEAYSQAAFHSAYNYNSLAISAMAGYGPQMDTNTSNSEADRRRHLKGYGYV